MSNRRGKSKVKVSGAKPELPPFLQRIREQLVADEDADRKEQSEKKRKSRPIRAEDPEDAPELVRVGDEEITEEEFERMKEALETQYRLESKKARVSDDLDIDYLIKNRENQRILKGPIAPDSKARDDRSSSRPGVSSSSKDKTSPTKSTVGQKNTKTLSYGYSSSEED